MCELSLTFFLDQLLVTLPFDGFLFSEAIGKQEYIPVGCVPSALYRMVESLSGGLPDRDPPGQIPPSDRDFPDRDPPWTEITLYRDPPRTET